MNIEHIVLLDLCRHNLDWINCQYPISSTLISDHYNIPLVEVRKALKNLKNQGMVESFKRCYVGEDSNCILNGWRITDKALVTKEYEQAKKEEERFIEYLTSSTYEEDVYD